MGKEEIVYEDFEDYQRSPLADLSVEALSGAADTLLAGVSRLRRSVRGFTDKVAAKTDTLAAQKPAAAKTLGLVRDLRLLEKVNVRTLHSLLDDHDEDIMLKSQIIDHLDSPVAASLPFVEVVETIAKSCFDRGIKPDRLIAFFTDRHILEMMVDETIVQGRASYRANNLIATGASFVDGLLAHVRFSVDGIKKEKVDPKMAIQLKKYIAFFKKTYDPKDLTNTFTQFIQQLEKKYPKHDIRGWLRDNKDLLAEVIYDQNEQQYHVEKIINEAYVERGKNRPAEFIEMNVGEFLSVGTANSAQMRKVIARSRGQSDSLQVSEDQKYVLLTADHLEEFFDDTLLRLATKDRSPKDIQILLLKLCQEKLFKEIGEQPLSVVVCLAKRNIISMVAYELEDRAAMWKCIETEIRARTKTLSSHIDVLNLLSEPQEVPEEITSLYQELFDEETGELHEERYNNYLKSLFGALRGGRKERITTVKPRVEGILKEVTNYFLFLLEELGYTVEALPLDILNNNDYAELLMICATNDDPRDRFIARLKLELAAIIYSCEATPRKVYQEHDAKAIAAYFQHADPGIRIKASAQIKEEVFYEDPEGNIYKSNDGRPDLVERKILLMPAKFGDVNCHLVVDGKGEFENQKSLFSMITKLLHRDRRRAKDLTDLIRKTVVGDNPEDIERINAMLETYYLSFGRQIKRERTNGKGKGNSGVRPNVSKSADFSVDAFVADIPVEDISRTNTYFAPGEIMVTDLDRLRVQTTERNALGHRQYEIRRIREIIVRLLPLEVFPEYYVVSEPDPDDISGKLTVQLRPQGYLLSSQAA